ncbi:MAG: aspartate carbamoyltransferase catalytic subunit [Candidatus Kapabacteria bacterium]|nr:aspartate carbamoyltransferase catalytic subunit [Candidatus Kapabacteria bacterium]
MNKDKLLLPYLLNASDLNINDIELIFSQADYFMQNYKTGEKFNNLKGIVVAMAFLESSARTKLSFELAAKRLSADTLSFQSSQGSQNKYESLIDTLHSIEAAGADIFVVRHGNSGVPHFFQENTKAVILNAGDGNHEHPSQALLDLYTLQKHFGKVEGLKVCIIGDIIHSRVAHSDISILKTLGAEVKLCSPGTLLPRHINVWDCDIIENIDDAVDWADALIVLRLKREIIESGILPDIREYSKYFGISYERFSRKPGLVLMHPGPVNYGIELDYRVSGFPNCLIQTQAAHGVFIRMAILSLLGKHLKKNG